MRSHARWRWLEFGGEFMFINAQVARGGGIKYTRCCLHTSQWLRWGMSVRRRVAVEVQQSAVSALGFGNMLVFL